MRVERDSEGRTTDRSLSLSSHRPTDKITYSSSDLGHWTVAGQQPTPANHAISHVPTNNTAKLAAHVKCPCRHKAGRWRWRRRVRHFTMGARSYPQATSIAGSFGFNIPLLPPGPVSLPLPPSYLPRQWDGPTDRDGSVTITAAAATRPTIYQLHCAAGSQLATASQPLAGWLACDLA